MECVEDVWRYHQLAAALRHEEDKVLKTIVRRRWTAQTVIWIPINWQWEKTLFRTLPPQYTMMVFNRGSAEKHRKYTPFAMVHLLHMGDRRRAVQNRVKRPQGPWWSQPTALELAAGGGQYPSNHWECRTVWTERRDSSGRELQRWYLPNC